MSTSPLPSAAPAGRVTTFGPSALLTPANGITLVRIAAAPVLVVLIMVWGASWFTLGLWVVLSVTDGIDGWVARRMGTTRSGAFLDPLADKAAVLGALAALAGKGIISWWPVGLIAAREIGMSVYRTVVGRRGVSIPARMSAKVKTFWQDVAIGLCIAPVLSGHRTVLSTVIWVAVALTLYTGGEYLVDGRRAVRAGPAGSGIPGGPGKEA